MTPDQAGDGVRRRGFIAIATADYDDRSLPELPQARDAARGLAAWFCAAGLGDRRFTHEYRELADNPTEDQLRAALRNPDPSRRWRDTDAAVVYIAGRGISRRDGHWLALRATRAAAYKSTALRTSDIIGWLTDANIRHLLLIIDTCDAGDVAGGVPFPDPLPATWLVLAGTERNEEAAPLLLTDAIGRVLAELGGQTGQKFGRERYLPVEEFCAAVSEKLGGAQRLVPVPGSQQSGPHECLPNPQYRPPAAVATRSALRDLALPKKDMEVHWEPRALGATRPPALGWLFTGRVALMGRLIDATRAPGALLVTGRAGSGKSAALARLVTLSDPEFRRRYADRLALIPGELIPPEGAVDVAVLATGKSATEIMTQVGRAVGALNEAADSDLPGAWRDWLSRAQPVTIVIDALDEANGSADDIVKVLQRLDGQDPDTQGPRLGQVRLIVGVRSVGRQGRDDGAPAPRIGKQLADLVQEKLRIGAARRVQVDRAPWWARHDVADYVTSLLRLTAGSPYREAAAATVQAVAEIVADRAGRSFLFANLAAEQLARGDAVVDTNDPAWRASISQGVLGLFRTDLRDTLPDPDDRLRAVDLLRAVAFAFGPGLPWRNVWPLVATAVADDQYQYGDGDITWLLGTRLGGYLVTDSADGITVYRLFHDDLRGILYDRWEELLVP